MLDPSQLNQVCYTTLQFEEPWSYDNYRSLGGYEAWQRVLKGERDAETIIE